MRSQEEKNETIDVLRNLDVNSSSAMEIDAMIDVIENDLSWDEIEDKYYDANETDIEQQANCAREWLIGEIDLNMLISMYV